MPRERLAPYDPRVRWRVMRVAVAIVAAVACVLGSAAATHAQAAPYRLLVQGDAPPGFGKLHTKVYTTWVKKMKVVTTTKGVGEGTSSCDAMPGSRNDGWMGGAIQAFDSPGLISAFELCESVFTASAGAHAAYAADGRQIDRQAARAPNLRPLRGPMIGDASQGVSASKQGLTMAALVFRHGDTVVELIYLGSGAFTTADFVATAQRADDRIP